MGFKLTWLSIKGKDRTVIFSDLGVRHEGAAGAFLTDETVGRALDNDTYLVVAVNDLERHLEPGLLRAVSRGATVLVCHVHEGCMYSHAAHWRDGVEIWRVEHDRAHGIRHLAVTGEPPPELESIRAKRDAAQDAEPPRKPRTLRDSGLSAGMWGFPPDLLQMIAEARSPRAVPGPPTMGVDHFFDVPVDLCEALTGLRHDRGSFRHGLSFEVLVRAG